MVGERLSLSGTHLNLTPPVQCATPNTIPHKTVSTESVNRVLKSVSRQSLLGELIKKFAKIY